MFGLNRKTSVKHNLRLIKFSLSPAAHNDRHQERKVFCPCGEEEVGGGAAVDESSTVSLF